MSLAGYTTLLDLTRQMLELAKQQEWESLAQAQEQRAKLIAGMSATNPALPPAELAPVAASIREIQGLDQEILAYVTPWREDVAKLLSRLAPSP